MKKINANIDYGLNIITIKYNGQQQEIPVTCTQKLDPTKYMVIEMREEEFHIKDKKYSKNFLEILKQQHQLLSQNFIFITKYHEFLG